MKNSSVAHVSDTLVDKLSSTAYLAVPNAADEKYFNLDSNGRRKGHLVRTGSHQVGSASQARHKKSWNVNRLMSQNQYVIKPGHVTEKTVAAL